MKLKNIHADVWIGGVLIVLSMIFFAMAGQFSNPDAATWPKAILIGILILSAMVVVHGLKLTQLKTGQSRIFSEGLAGPMLALLAIVLYAVLMNFTGYFVSTAIFLPLGMFFLGQRNWKAIFGVTVGLELFVYILFVVQLQLRMP
ncbi:tripartite tricarboxylate transporter TctB family protein [Oscillibacter sp. GMB15532]|uniref:tripartite tricarboxylate transporter TctB family protein n=1 Tax=Oscillibacter sp. GMB15532 TaxID=3230022 RepID=UPI0034DE3DF2